MATTVTELSDLVGTLVQLRPQPLGVFPFPAGLLLLPDAGEKGRVALNGLMRGEANVALPEPWRFFELALSGDITGALKAVSGEDAIAIHNRIALGEDLPGDNILHRAVRYAVGRDEAPPTAEGLDAELLAFVLMLQTTYAIEHNQLWRAMGPLKEAIEAVRNVSPEFAAQLLGQLAALEGEQPSLAIQHYHEALALATGNARGDLSLQLGMALQESARGDRTKLLQAVTAYQNALRFGIGLERNPESYALVQNNLALAYLAMPMSETGEQQRMGIAVQSLQEALKVYTKEAYPEQWASAQLNLANALQYMPSSHPEENLVRAVEIYDEILSFRSKAFDPVGYARLLANQANAMAHLGKFASAMEKIGEAYKLFQRHNEPDMAASAMSLMESIHEQQGPTHGLA